MASSVEPPPTSTTPTRPSSDRPSVRVAPRKASRASSSPSRTWTSTPPASRIAAANSSWLTAARMAAVATTRSASAPSCSTIRRCSPTTRATSSIFSRGMPPPLSPLPMRVNARRWSTSRSRPSSTSATSTRVVFEPMSMQAQSIRLRGGCHDGRVTAIEVQGLHKSYGDHEAVRGIDFEVRRGEVFGLLGPNGAGKTTTVEILEGYRTRTAGSVSVLGHDPATRDPDLRARVGIVLQSSGIYRYLTVHESVAHWAGFYPRPRDVEEVISIVGLEEAAEQRANKLSGGQQRRLDLALALVGDPELVFLDEPTTGFDPAARRAAWGTVRSLKELGKTVLLTTHYLDEAQALADRVAIIKDGTILAEGAPGDLGGSSRRYRVAWRDAAGGPHARETDDPTPLLHELTGEALARGGRVDDLSVTRPSLEEVYLELTAEADA